MKKFIILIIAVILVLALALTGCSGKIKDSTISNTQDVWDKTENKSAKDVITIYNFKIAGLIIVDNAVITIERKFEKNKVAIDFALSDMKCTVTGSGRSVLSLVLPQVIPPDSGINLSVDDLVAILNNLNLSGKITLTNNKKLDYDIKMNGSSIQTGSVEIQENGEYNESIKQSINLLTSHLSAVFAPSKDGKAVFNPSKLNSVIKSAIEYEEANNPNINESDYVPISQKIINIMGVSYNKILTNKINIVSSKSKCKISKDFIKEMELDYFNIQFLYNKKQLMKVLKNALVEMGQDSYANIVEKLDGLVQEVTPNVSCIEIESINVVSKYTI